MANKHGDFIWYELMTSDAAAAPSSSAGFAGVPRRGGEPPIGDAFRQTFVPDELNFATITTIVGGTVGA